MDSTPFTLRPYQRGAVSVGAAYLQNTRLRGRHGLIVAPTGSGKSLIIAGLVAALEAPCLVFQPSREILEQNEAKLRSYGYRPAVYSASFGRREQGEITLATIGSVVGRPEAFRHVPYVLIDEAHAVNAREGMYRTFLSTLSQARFLGLTATPYRLATNSFGSELRFLTRTRPRVFRDLVHYTQIGDLLRDGYLCPLVYRQQPFERRRLALNTTGADYTDQSVQLYFHEIDFSGRLQATVEGLLAEGRQHILVFTRFVSESQALAAALPGVAVVTGETPDPERRQILDDFKAGRIRVVTNVGVLAVGFDFPGLDTVVLARPTVSLALYYQQVGRAIRPDPTKAEALVVDLVGLVEQFGRVEDLVLEPGGKRGECWTVTSQGRPLTNVFFGDRAPQAKPESWPGDAARRAIA